MESVRRCGRSPVALLVVAIAVIALLLGVAVAGVGASVTPASGDDHTAPVSIEGATTGGEQVVAVVFEGPSPKTLAATDDPRQLLESHAAERFAPLEALAESDPSVTIEDQSWLAHAVTVRVDTAETPLSTLAALPAVVAVETAGEPVTAQTGAAAVTTQTVDPLSSATYGLEQANVPAAWATFGTTGEGASIAVLDTGVDPTHPDITVTEWRDFNPDDPSSTPIDYGDHGTHVAGTAVGGDDSGTHIGVAPAASLYVGAVLTDCSTGECTGSREQVIDGMEWAVASGVDVISLSLGGEGYSTQYLQAVEHAHALGTIVVAATGNDGVNTASTPGNVYDVISVGASTDTEQVWWYSGGKEIVVDDSWGASAPEHWPETYLVPDVTAAGQHVYSTLPGGGYGYMTGTSMATPHVAGTVALMQSATDRDLSPEEVRLAISESANHPDGPTAPQDIRYGHGMLDAHGALSAVVDTGRLTGTVSDGVTDAPLSAATVTIEGTTREVTTDADGRFEIGALEPGTYTLIIERDGYETSTTVGVQVTTDSVTDVDIAVSGAGSIEVIVDGALFDGAVEGASVVAHGQFGAYGGETAPDGRVVIDAVPAVGTYDIEVTAAGYDRQVATVSVIDPETPPTATVSLVGDATLAIEALDSVTGVPLDGVAVEIQRNDGVTASISHTTDETGTLAVSVPGTGDSYTVTGDRAGYDSASATTTVDTGATAPLDLELTGDGEVAVEVSDALFGGLIDGVTVELTGAYGTYQATDTDEGTYTLDGVPSVGEYALSVKATGYTSSTTVVEVAAAGATATSVELEGDATLEITVVDEDDEPVAGAEVHIERSDGFEAILETSTPASGTVDATVPGLGEAYEIHASAEDVGDGTESTDPVDPGATLAVTVTLTEPSFIPGFGAGVAALAIAILVAYLITRRQSVE